MKIARSGTWTKMLFLAAALGAFASDASAAEPNCRAIESTGARLSCYDAAFPPQKVKKPAAANVDGHQDYKDPFLEEEARTSAKLKNICRGC